MESGREVSRMEFIKGLVLGGLIGGSTGTIFGLLVAPEKEDIPNAQKFTIKGVSGIVEDSPYRISRSENGEDYIARVKVDLSGDMYVDHNSAFEGNSHIDLKLNFGSYVPDINEGDTVYFNLHSGFEPIRTDNMGTQVYKLAYNVEGILTDVFKNSETQE